jgi:hypothetical protein
MISFLARCDAQNEVHALGMRTSPVSPGINLWTQPGCFHPYSIVISVAAPAGVFLARLRGREWLSFACVLGLYPLLYYMTYAFSCYRHAIEPTMYVLAASAFSELAFYFGREVSGLSE